MNPITSTTGPGFAPADALTRHWGFRPSVRVPRSPYAQSAPTPISPCMDVDRPHSIVLIREGRVQ